MSNQEKLSVAVMVFSALGEMSPFTIIAFLFAILSLFLAESKETDNE